MKCPSPPVCICIINGAAFTSEVSHFPDLTLICVGIVLPVRLVSVRQDGRGTVRLFVPIPRPPGNAVMIRRPSSVAAYSLSGVTISYYKLHNYKNYSGFTPDFLENRLSRL